MAEKKVVLTYECLKNMEAELENLKTVRRKDVAEKIKEARGQGDLSENAEYDAAMNDQAQMESHIRELEYTIEHAIIIDDSALTLDTVRVGLSVRVEDKTYGGEEIFHIVGIPDVKPFENKFSDDSPIGRALVGHSVGDTVIAETPDGNDELTILEIFKN